MPQEDINQKFRSFRDTPLDIPEEEDVDFSGTPISQYPQPPRPEAEQTSTANLAPVSQSPTMAPTQQVAAAGAPPSAAQAGVAPLGGSRTLSAANNPQLQQQLAGGGNPVAALKNLQATGNV